MVLGTSGLLGFGTSVLNWKKCFT